MQINSRKYVRAIGFACFCIIRCVWRRGVKKVGKDFARLGEGGGRCWPGGATSRSVVVLCLIDTKEGIAKPLILFGGGSSVCPYSERRRAYSRTKPGQHLPFPFFWRHAMT